MRKLFTVVLAITSIGLSQQQAPMPAPANPSGPTALPIVEEVVTAPRVVTRAVAGSTVTMKFLIRFQDGSTTRDLRYPGLGIVTYSDNTDVTAKTTKCELPLGECKITSQKPGPLILVVFLGALGRSTTVINFFQPQASQEPPFMPVTASTSQAKVGATVTVTATSPVTLEGPVQVLSSTRFTNPANQVENFIFLPNGIEFGQQIKVNTEVIDPLTTRSKRYFSVRIIGSGGAVEAQGLGSSVSEMETESFRAVVDQNGDLRFFLSEPYDSRVQYRVFVQRETYLVELSQRRGELYSYPDGNGTNLVFIKGSTSPNFDHLPIGRYNITVMGENQTGDNWVHTEVDGLILNNSLNLK